MNPGDIYKTRVDVFSPAVNQRENIGREGYVVILTPPRNYLKFQEVQIAPISLETGMAAELDLLAEAAHGPFEKPFVIQLWNTRPMLIINLGDHVGSVDPEIRRRIRTLYIAMASGEQIPNEWVGPPLTGETDPRYRYQRKECLAATFMSDPVFELLYAK